jgi:hypothetical protein
MNIQCLENSNSTLIPDLSGISHLQFKLSIKFKQYRIIPNYLVNNLNMTELDLSENKIVLIESKAFKNNLNQSQLTVLSLNLNRIKTIQIGTFEDLHQLRILLLFKNSIDDLREFSFLLCNIGRHVCIGGINLNSSRYRFIEVHFLFF